MLKFYKNQTYYLENAIINELGDFESGLSVTYEIRKSGDNTLIDSGSMIEEGNIYKKAVTLSVAGNYRVLYFTPLTYENGSESIVVEDISIDDLDVQIKRLLGLGQENYRLINPQYDKAYNLVGGTIKIYPTAGDVDTDTNAIANYAITATFDRRNRMTDYKVKKL